MRSVFFVALSVVALTTVGAAGAHHSFAAEFDIAKPVRLTGSMTNIEWTNPHAWLFMDVENDNGGSDAWAVELVGANGLLRRGWTRESIKVGDVITVEGFAARDGSNTANASTVVIAGTGERLYASSRDD
jgi:hypothetical protein